MLCYLHQWLLVLLPTWSALLPWVSARSVWSAFDTPSVFTSGQENDRTLEGYNSNMKRTGIEKRKANSDPWGICPHTMRRIDCFYQYLSIYDRIRDDMEESSPRTYRNIGKRGGDDRDSAASRNSDGNSVMKDILSSRSKDILAMDSEYLPEYKDGRRVGNFGHGKNEVGVSDVTTTCPLDWTLLECLMSGFSLPQSLEK